jgi:hypothetical protein
LAARVVSTDGGRKRFGRRSVEIVGGARGDEHIFYTLGEGSLVSEYLPSRSGP